jgi:DNA-directed RNA polymerase specialized sigma24 family protein
MADNIGLTTDETIGIFYRYHHLLRPRRRLVFHLIELHDHTHEELVARRQMTTVDASRTELKRARHDLRRIAETQGARGPAGVCARA